MELLPIPFVDKLMDRLAKMLYGCVVVGLKHDTDTESGAG